MPSLREARLKYLEAEPFSIFLDDASAQAFIDGRCQLSLYQGTWIVDYTRPSGATMAVLRYD